MNRALVAIGSNLGDRQMWVNQALLLINETCGRLAAVSSFRATDPIGAADQTFLNGACVLETTLTPTQLLQALLNVEKLLGREREVHWGNRNIDLDIILWRDETGKSLSYESATLTIPHPEATNRDFVMQPAMEIAGDWVFPNLSLTVEEIVAHKAWRIDQVSSEAARANLVQ